jgi:uncharacterized repeat protein (TIGR01451 family)
MTGSILTLFKRRKRRIAALSAFLMLWAFVAPLRAVPPPPTPGDQVLLIHVNNTYGNTMATNIKAALNALPVAQRPTITELLIPVGDKNGIYDNLTSAGLSLSNYCQVWDFRFMELNNSSAFSGTIQEDSITTSGANNDSSLFVNFLANGGHMFVIADNDQYYARNEGVIQFIADATGSAITYPNANSSASFTTISNAAPELFRTAYDTLVAPINCSVWPGFIPLSGVGTGTPLTYNGTSTLDLLWESSALKPGNGKLMVNFDTSMFNVPDPQVDGYTRNTYTTLGTCYNFTVTKAVSPASVCAGDPATFTICYSNTGTRAIPNAQVWDTLPNCTVFSSASPAASFSSGQYYRFDLGTVNAGASGCVSIDVQTTVCP